MILAAGRGERMGALTADTPKPLLRVGGQYLIEHAIANIVAAGIHDIVINISYHGNQIKEALGNGERYGVSIVYSEEKERLEVGGGIVQALPLLGREPFIVMSSDIVTDFPLATLSSRLTGLAHLVMVDNPAFHTGGDFGIQNGYANRQAMPTLTFASIGIYHPALFETLSEGHFRWSKVLFPAIDSGQVTAEKYAGTWFNVGTPEELLLANQSVKEA